MKRLFYIILCLATAFTACNNEKQEPGASFEDIIKAQPCKTCDDFLTQLEARNYVVNLKPECYEQLSTGGDSVFCPNLPVDGRAISIGSCKQCSDFLNEAEAKAYADSVPNCRFVIDPNFNGVYCERTEGTAFSDGSFGGNGCWTCDDFQYLETASYYFLNYPLQCFDLISQDTLVCPQLPTMESTIGQPGATCQTCSDFKWREAAILYLGYRYDCFDATTFDTATYCKELPSFLH